MAKANSAKLLPRAPGARASRRSYFWAFIGPTVALGLLFAITFGMLQTQVQERKSFEGVLRPVASPVGLALPKHAPLKQILVSEGEIVRRGQTLALLNEVALLNRQTEIARQLSEYRLLRACLSPRYSSSFVDGLQTVLADDDAETRQRLLLVGQDCALRDAAAEALTAAGQSDVEVLGERIRLLGNRISVFVEQQNQGEPGVTDRASAAIETLLEKNALEADLRDARQTLTAQTLARAEIRRKEALALTTKISALMEEQQRLDSLIANPRLTAPANGVVSRVRDPGEGHVALHDVRIFEIARAGAGRFSLAISVPPDQISRLRDGARVDVRLVGQPNVAPLGGTIDLERPQQSPLGTRAPAAAGTVMVNLDGESRLRLRTGIRTAKLGGSATASDVTVTVGKTRFSDLLGRSIAAAFPGHQLGKDMRSRSQANGAVDAAFPDTFAEPVGDEPNQTLVSRLRYFLGQYPASN